MIAKATRVLAACCTVAFLALAISGCGGSSVVSTDRALNIIAGSEQQTVLDDIVVPWCKSQGIACTYTLKGSVNQARLLQDGDTSFNVYWFASTVFLQIGNQHGKLQHVKPMFVTPLVFAGWQSEMQRLGFTGHDPSIPGILAAVESHKTTTWITNPSQSNSGATVYLGFLNYFAGNGPRVPLTLAQLNTQPVENGITRFVRAMAYTPPSTGTMMNDCLAHPNVCRTMFTYEALVIEKNQELVKQGHEPLYVVYPRESLAIADAPMGFLPPADATSDAAKQKEQDFLKLQDYLLSTDTQQKLMTMGRRPITSIGLSIEKPDLGVFNPSWGIKATLKEQPITYPAAPVIETALNRYQTAYRKPVDTVYCLDGSGSMDQNGGWDGLQKGVRLIFDQAQARQYYLQTNPDDVTTVIIFNGSVAAGPWTVAGNDAARLLDLYTKVSSRSPDDGTDLYSCLSRAAEVFRAQDDQQRKRLVILMTDGQSDTGGKDTAIAALQDLQVPVVSIAFGSDADTTQLQELADVTHGTVVDSNDLVAALKQATGYR